MSKILFRQSSGPLGDTFFTAHYMVHQKLQGNKVYAAIPTDLNPEIRKLYYNFTFIDGVIELSFFLDDNKFLSYCSEMGFLPCRYLLDLEYLKGLIFRPLCGDPFPWFKNDTEPTIDTSNSIGFQIASSQNYDRPRIPNLNAYLDQVKQAGLTPVFFGTKKDEKLFIKNYPAVHALYRENDISWRFGKDTLLQTIANIKNLKGHIVFSSGTSPIAAFYGVPVLELWTREQWQFFSPLAHYMLGSPIHHIMQSYDEYPSPVLIKEIFPRLRKLCDTFYNVFRRTHKVV